MQPILPVEPTELDKKALAFLTEHPDVWREFVRFTFDLINAGRRYGGAKSVWERIRWDVATSAHVIRNEAWAMNNTHVSSIARIFAATFPAHTQFFVTRKRPTERKAA